MIKLWVCVLAVLIAACVLKPRLWRAGRKALGMKRWLSSAFFVIGVWGGLAVSAEAADPPPSGTDADFLQPQTGRRFASLRRVEATDNDAFIDMVRTVEGVKVQTTGDAFRLVASTHRDEVAAGLTTLSVGELTFAIDPAHVLNALDELDQAFDDAGFPRAGLYSVACRVTIDWNLVTEGPFCFPDSSTYLPRTGGISSGGGYLNDLRERHDQFFDFIAPHTTSSTATYFIPRPHPGQTLVSARFRSFLVVRGDPSTVTINGHRPEIDTPFDCPFGDSPVCLGSASWDLTADAVAQIGGELLVTFDPNPPGFDGMRGFEHARFQGYGLNLSVNYPWTILDTSGVLELTYQQPLQVELLDPVPDLLDGAAVTANRGRLAQAGQVVQGAAADGVTRVVVRVRAPQAGTVELTLVDAAAAEEAGLLTSLGGAMGSNSVVVPTEEVGEGGPMAFAVYQAPSDFVRAGSGDANERDRQVSLRVRFTPQTGGAPQEAVSPIKIARPPVVLVHGLWGSRDSWNGFGPLVNDARFFVRPVNYRDSNARSFGVNFPVVGRQIRREINEYKASEQVAAVQADVVTHSMGGLLVRGLPLLGEAYFRPDNFQQGDVHKLINIGTPHFGSELAARLRTKVNNFRCRAVFSGAGAPIHQGAIHDLSPGSAGLRELNGFVSALPLHNNVGIASERQKEVNASGALINAVQSPLVCGRILPPGGFDALFRDDNDLLVSASSQRARLSPTSPAVGTFTPLIHTRAGGFFDVADGAAELESEEVSREVIELLNLPVDDAQFTRLSPP